MGGLAGAVTAGCAGDLRRRDRGRLLPARSEPLPIEVDVPVVGAGKAGLGAAYWLARRPGLRVLVVDRATTGLPGSHFRTGATRRVGVHVQLGEAVEPVPVRRRPPARQAAPRSQV